MPVLQRLVALSLALTLTVACSAERVGPAVDGGGDPTIVATVGGEPITLGELEAWIKEDLFRKRTGGQPEAVLYELRSEALEEMIDARLLEEEATRQGVEAEILVQQQAVVPDVSDETVTSFYEANRSRLGDVTLEQIAARIRQHLEQQGLEASEGRFRAGLRERAGVEVRLEPPRAEVAAVGPSLGPEAAPVTIVEFSDFQCPFCARAEPVVRQILERYPEQVRVVYRHLPLESIHPRARAAAEASACADEQGRFWEYHSLLFANNGALEDADLKGYAEKLGLDAAQFGACLDERRYQQVVDRDLRAATQAGAQGTPAFFVNGIMLGGAVPIEDFVELVESELQRLGAETS